MEALVDVIEEARQSAIAREGEHHPAVAGHAEEAAVPDADDDEGDQDEGAVGAEDVHEDLEDGLAVVGGRVDRVVEVLDREEQAEHQEEAEDGGDADGHENADGRAPGCPVGFFREMRGCVEAFFCVSFLLDRRD